MPTPRVHQTLPPTYHTHTHTHHTCKHNRFRSGRERGRRRGEEEEKKERAGKEERRWRRDHDRGELCRLLFFAAMAV
ncbi:hypothetical protein Scep_022826 [Stephania cephalantha]|uniref:Uncharacterized protein n=1 Tax=Stephania cephalantha TaxID=152367 RepID=A0AAP0F8S6_9MAGN